MLADRPEIKAALVAQPFGLIEPNDVAQAAVFLASDVTFADSGRSGALNPQEAGQDSV